MTTETKLLTAEEFMLLPEPPGSGKMELVYGEVRTMAPVGGEHGATALDIGAELRDFAREHQLGIVGVEIGFRLQSNPDLVLAPDVSFVNSTHLPGGRFDASFVEGPPTLAVEVVSPGDSATAIASKVANYLRHGTERVWVVHPGLHSVTVHRPSGDSHTYGENDTLTSGDAGFALEGFALKVAEIFA